MSAWRGFGWVVVCTRAGTALAARWVRLDARVERPGNHEVS
nr:MAG TPA: hypothetical protein [Caudoviricetes sp.]